jgi:hypothetical protein
LFTTTRKRASPGKFGIEALPSYADTRTLEPWDQLDIDQTCARQNYFQYVRNGTQLRLDWC